MSMLIFLLKFPYYIKICLFILLASNDTVTNLTSYIIKLGVSVLQTWCFGTTTLLNKNSLITLITLIKKQRPVVYYN
jgi:hypothetical protein